MKRILFLIIIAVAGFNFRTHAQESKPELQNIGTKGGGHSFDNSFQILNEARQELVKELGRLPEKFYLDLNLTKSKLVLLVATLEAKPDELGEARASLLENPETRKPR